MAGGKITQAIAANGELSAADRQQLIQPLNGILKRQRCKTLKRKNQLDILPEDRSV